VAFAIGCSSDIETGPPPVLITSAATLPVATVGVPYHFQFTAVGGMGVFTWGLVGSTLPPGITLSEAGLLSGVAMTTFDQTVVVRARSASREHQASFALRVDVPPLEIVTPTLPNATLGASYSHFLEASGGSGAVTWSLASGALPSGIQLVSGGVISGNPSTLGTSSFRLRATRGSLVAERSFTLVVVPPPLVILTSTLPPATSGIPYFVQLESGGGIGGNLWTLSGGSLPAGLALSGGGALAGTPSVAGAATFTVTVSSGAQHASQALTLAVEPDELPSQMRVTMPGNVFVPLLVRLARGGTVTWVFGAAPHNVIFAPTPGAPADINIVSDVEVARTFSTAGTFRYDCTIHPGMSGVVEVKP